MKKEFKIGIAVTILIVAIIGFTSGNETEQNVDKITIIAVGDDGLLNNNQDKANCEGGSLAGTTQANYDELTNALIADDRFGYLELLGYGQIFHIDNCTKVRVIDIAFGVRKFRILEGNNIGAAGWIAYEFIK